MRNSASAKSSAVSAIALALDSGARANCAPEGAKLGTDRNDRLETLPTGPGQYDVGYCKPPEASRFKPGQSGNPKGRPRGARNKMPALNEEHLKAIVIREAYRPIKVREGKMQISTSIAEALVRSLAVNAARGQPRAQQMFLKMLSETERANKATMDGVHVDLDVVGMGEWFGPCDAQIGAAIEFAIPIDLVFKRSGHVLGDWRRPAC
jgi:Family of unknown function (DUF5681)